MKTKEEEFDFSEIDWDLFISEQQKNLACMRRCIVLMIMTVLVLGLVAGVSLIMF
ncbi:MAG: hypothetical protein RR365_06840 [Bacteroides sp.]